MIDTKILRKLMLPLAIAGIFVSALVSGCITLDTGISGRSPDWTDETHGNKADPDYSVVFPQDLVNTMTIVLSPEEWQAILDDLDGQLKTSDNTRGDGMNRGVGGDGMFDYDTIYVPADIIFNDMIWTDVGIRVKGQSTLQRTWQSGSYKFSFKLNFDKFEDENPEIKNQRFYGFDELSLKNGMGDSSLLKDLIVPRIFNEVGVIAPATALYRVYVDYGEGPVYFGVYTMIESVEDTLIETRFDDDSGNVYKPEGTGATFASGTFDISAFEKKTNKGDGDYSDVETLYTVLNSDRRTDDPAAWREELELIFDTETFIRWLAVTTVIENWDVYGNQCKNFYLYFDSQSNQLIWIPWDHNEALPYGGEGIGGGGLFAGERMKQEGTGVSPESGFSEPMPQMDTVRSGRGEMPQFGDSGDMPQMNTVMGERDGMPGFTPSDGFQNRGGTMGRSLSLGLTEVGDNWPLIRYLIDDPIYYAQYLEALDDVVSDAFEPSKMEETYRFYHELIAPYVVGDEGEVKGYTNLNSPEQFEASLDLLINYTWNRQAAVQAFLTSEDGVYGVEA